MGIQNSFLTLYGQFAAASVVFAAYLMYALRRISSGRRSEAAELVVSRIDVMTLALCVVPAAFVGARLLYCLFRFDFFFIEMGPASVLRTWEGGFLLYGAVIGALAAAALLAKVKGVSCAHLLDELAVPGAAAVVICRMAEGMTTEGVGTWVENELLWRFPIAVQDEWGDWYYAVFLLEALCALIILFYLLRFKAAPGEKIMTALLLYAACQIVLESMRMDACLRIGFVRVSQVLSAVAVLVVTLIRSLRIGRRQAAVSGAVCIAFVAGGGIIEWALDKTPLNNVLLYAGMIACCAVLVWNGMRYTRKA